MDRTEFLDRLRSGLAPDNLPHPIPKFTAIPSVVYTRRADDPPSLFVARAEVAGATVREVTDLRQLIEEVVAEHGIRTAVASADPETTEAARRLMGAGVEVLPFDGPRPEADLGVTGASWGIAVTGSLVVDAGRAGGRSASLLPPVHLALVRRDRILPDSGALFGRLARRFPEGLPSQFVLITGPSRSADIELTLTMGVHGPKHLWVGILPD